MRFIYKIFHLIVKLINLASGTVTFSILATWAVVWVANNKLGMQVLAGTNTILIATWVKINEIVLNKTVVIDPLVVNVEKPVLLYSSIVLIVTTVLLRFFLNEKVRDNSNITVNVDLAGHMSNVDTLDREQIEYMIEELSLERDKQLRKELDDEYSFDTSSRYRNNDINSSVKLGKTQEVKRKGVKKLFR